LAYVKKEDKAAARKTFETALQIDENFPEAGEARKILADL
jgi:Tfp pilus assembly protein PilF